jgi:hypothetical protein
MKTEGHPQQPALNGILEKGGFSLLSVVSDARAITTKLF